MSDKQSSTQQTLFTRGMSCHELRTLRNTSRLPETVRDIVIGMSDGLDGAVRTGPRACRVRRAATAIIITAGLAEVAAGAIAMGLGGYLAARTDAEHYVSSERAREERETDRGARRGRGRGSPNIMRLPTASATKRWLLWSRASGQTELAGWTSMMQLSSWAWKNPDPRRARNSAWTIALSYIAGGLVPLAPYFFLRSVHITP